MKAEKEDSVDIKKIGATLKHGRFVAYNFKLGCFGIVFSFAVLIGSYFLFYKERQSAPVPTYIVIIAAWALLFFWSLYTIIQTVKIRKEVSLWLLDAVELDAFGDKVFRANYNGLRVYFVYNNENTVKLSRCKHWNAQEGFDIWWQYYINKNIKIYYSPKYDEVMLFLPKAPAN